MLDLVVKTQRTILERRRLAGTRAAKVSGGEWSYDPADGQYRDPDGQKVSDSRLRAALDLYLDSQRERVRQATADLAAGYSTVPEWQVAVRAIVKSAHGGAYMLGRGGRHAMTQADWGRLGVMVREQYRHLNGFARDVTERSVSAEQAMARSAMYVSAAREGYSKGTAHARGWPDLPAQPGDGSTVCMVNCRCWWSVERNEDGDFEATWNVDDGAENCPECLDRSEAWAPLVLSAA